MFIYLPIQFNDSTHDQSSMDSTIPCVQYLLKIHLLFGVVRSRLSSAGSQFLVRAGSLGNLTFSGHYYR